MYITELTGYKTIRLKHLSEEKKYFELMNLDSKEIITVDETEINILSKNEQIVGYYIDYVTFYTELESRLISQLTFMSDDTFDPDGELFDGHYYVLEKLGDSFSFKVHDSSRFKVVEKDLIDFIKINFNIVYDDKIFIIKFLYDVGNNMAKTYYFRIKDFSKFQVSLSKLMLLEG